MPINIWSKPAQLSITPLPFEAIAAAGAAKQKAYDEGDKALTDLNDNFLKIGSLPVDSPRKQELVGGYQKEMNDIADSYGNDLGAALPKIKQLQRRLNADLSTGELGGIKTRYDGYLTRVKEIDDYRKKYIESGGKQGLSDEDAQNLLNYELTNPAYNGAPIKKTAYGTWNIYKPSEVRYTLNYNTKADEFAGKMKPEVITHLTGLQPVKDAAGNITGYMQHGDIKTTKLPAEAIKQATAIAMQLDPEVTGYRDWNARISGKADKIAQAMAENPNGFLTADGMSMISPEHMAELTLNKDIYNAAETMGLKYQQNEIDRNMSYMEDKGYWLGLEESKKQPYSVIAEAPAVDVPGTTVNTNFFDIKPVGSYVPYTPEEAAAIRQKYAGEPGGSAAAASEIFRGKGRTTEAAYNDLSSLSPSQRTQVDPYLETIKSDPSLAAAAERIQQGRGTKADQALVYPQLKKYMDIASKSTKMNSRVTNITDEKERPFVNSLLSSSKDETVTVEQLGTGFGENLTVTLPDGHQVPYKEFAAYAKKHHDAKSPISIQGKLRGVNGYTNSNGDASYGNAYQINIEGTPYLITGYKFDTSTPAGFEKEKERLTNEYVAEFGRAQSLPYGTMTTSYFGIPVQYAYTPDPNNPSTGTYTLMGIGADANGNIQKELPSSINRQIPGSAETFELYLKELVKTLGK
jgi:hypothetical protein